MTTNFERGFNDTIAAGGGLAGAGIGAAAGGLLGLLTNRKNRLRGALAGLLGGGAIGYGLGAHTNYLANKAELDEKSRKEQENIARQTQIDAARAARTKRMDEISARLTAAGIDPSSYRPYIDANDYEVDRYENEANYMLSRLAREKADEDAQLAREKAMKTDKMLGLSFNELYNLPSKTRDLLFDAHPELEEPYRAADARYRAVSADNNRRREARKETVRAAFIEKYKKELAEHQANRPTDLSGKVPLLRGGYTPAEFRFTQDGDVEFRSADAYRTPDGNLTYEWNDNWHKPSDYDFSYANDELRSWFDKNEDLSRKARNTPWNFDFYSHDADEYDPNSEEFWSHGSDFDFTGMPLSAFVE